MLTRNQERPAHLKSLVSFCPSYFRLCVRRCPCIEYWLSFDDASYVLSCHRAPSHIWQRKKGEYVICCLFFVRSHIEDYQHILKVCFWESWVFRTQRKLFLTFSLDVFLGLILECHSWPKVPALDIDCQSHEIHFHFHQCVKFTLCHLWLKFIPYHLSVKFSLLSNLNIVTDSISWPLLFDCNC